MPDLKKEKEHPCMRNSGISYVIPVFNNAPSLDDLTQQLFTTMARLTFDFEIIFIDDCSSDGSWAKITKLQKTYQNIRGYRFYKNHGQHIATLFGLNKADSPLAISMDADLQDRPEAISLLLETYQKNATEVVFAGRTGSYQSFPRMITSKLYRTFLLEKIVGLPNGAGMYFLISRHGIKRLLCLEKNKRPMVIGMIAAADLSNISIPFERSTRKYGGSAYTSLNRVQSAFNMLRCAFFMKPVHGAPGKKYLSSIRVKKCIT